MARIRRKCFARAGESARSKAAAREIHFDDDPIEHLRQLTARYRPVRVPGLPPLIAGAIGYFAYDMVRLIERIPATGRDDLALDDCVMMFFLGLVAFDHVQHRVWMIRNVFTEGKGSLRAKYDAAVREIEMPRRSSKDRCPSSAARSGIANRCASIEYDAPQFLAAVRKAKEYIRAGDIFQVVPSQRFSAQTNADPFEIYRALRVVNPSPYLYFLKLDDVSVVGSSPEMLVKVQGRDAFYRPIAGTRPRGRDEKEDRELEAKLLADPKERAEHIMLVDLGRNDLGPRLRIRLGEGRAADVRRALLARDASRCRVLRGESARRRGLLRRADGLLSRRHAFGRAESSRHGNH